MAEVKFKRIEDSNDIDNVPVVDGQIIYTKDGKNYLDYENTRAEIFGGTGYGFRKLWENENPTSSFSSQTITLSSSDYDMIIWFYKPVSDSSSVLSQITIKNYNALLFHWVPGLSRTYYRSITYVDDTTFTAGDCSYGGGTSITNGYVIPLYAIGFKTGVFGE